MIRALLDKDPAHLIRFAIVGVTVAALYVMLYVGFLSLGLAIWAANALAFGIAVLVQYVGQTAWTFRQQLGKPDQMLRFGCTIAFGFLTSVFLTGGLGPFLGWQDWISASVVAVVLPVQNYVFFRIWVYAERGKKMSNDASCSFFK